MLVGDLPELKSYTLREFTREAYRICTLNRLDANIQTAEDERSRTDAINERRTAMNNFSHFVLSGNHRVDPNNMHTVQLDILANMVTPERAEERIETLRDYDSLLGWSMDLTYSKPLEVYAVPPFTEILKEDLHIKVPIRLAGQVSSNIIFLT